MYFISNSNFQFKFQIKPTQYYSGMIHRNSVPRKPDMKEDEMRQFIQQLMTDAEEWKAIKMVVLGHGQIGKTTLLHTINQIVTPSVKV